MALPVKIKDEDVLDSLRSDIDKAKSVQDELALQREEYYKRYRGAAYGNERAGWSQSVAPVIANNLNWSLPSLMEIFHEEYFTLRGNDQPAQTDPQTGETSMSGDERASNFQKLIYYQMFRKQDGYRRAYDFLYNAYLYHYSIFKVCHREDFDIESEVLDRLSSEEMMSLVQEPGLTITKYDEIQDENGVSYEKVKTARKKVIYAGPSLECIPPWEWYYSPDCKIGDWGSIDGRLVYHEVTRTMNDIRKKERAKVYRKGSYQKVLDSFDEANRPSMKPDSYEVLVGVDEVSDVDTQAPETNELSKQVKIRECYYRLDIDGDGLLEPVIIVLCGDVILQLEENPYMRPPFRIGSVAPEPHKITGIAMPNVLDNDQKVMTNLLRLIQDSAAQSCYRNPVTNDQNMFKMLQDRKPFATILGSPEKIGEVKQAPPDTFILKTYEMVKGEIEEKTGNTRYNQGTDAASLNKMLDIETLVPMADGYWKTMGTIIAGDMVLGSDGKPTQVITAHRVDLPKRAYNITFKSGEVIKAGGEHLWTIQTGNDQRYDKSQTVDTDTLFEMHKKFKGKICIPRVERPQFGRSETLPLDPYILGLWLGDGHLYNARITTEDKGIVDYAAKWAAHQGGSLKLDKSQSAGKAKTYSFVGTGLHATLRMMKLAKRGGGDNEGIGKHIPGIYLRASYNERLALLRGLMDTDGCHHSGSLAIFTQKEGALVDDVVQLIEGLGGWPSKCITEPGMLAREGVKYYNVNFSIADNPFLLKKKADKWIPPQRGNTRQCILSIEPTDIVKMRCLTVDAPDHLFCVGSRFTVTSNTATGISAIFNASEKRMRMVAALMGNGPFAGVIRDFIFINQKWPSEDPIKLLGTNIVINKGDLDGEYDIEVDIGTSPADRQATANQIDLFIQFATQAGLQMGIVKPEGVMRAIRKKYRTLGVNMADCMPSEKAFMAEQAQKQKQPPPPDPNQIKMQMDQQMAQQKSQMEQQSAQMDMQVKQSEMQMEQQSQQAELQFKSQAHQQEMQFAQQEFQQKMQFNEELHRQTMEQKQQAAAQAKATPKVAA
jgi:hypothetical protein